VTETLSAHLAVAGIPATQGSLRTVGRGRVIHDNPQLPNWRRTIAWQARAARPPRWSKAGPFALDLTFYLPRPKSLPRHVTLPIKSRNDIDKLARAALDALSGVLYDDDGQVVDLTVRKRFGQPGLAITADHVMG
jgi:crossover junction endodeoxyribonuclease RusA